MASRTSRIRILVGLTFLIQFSACLPVGQNSNLTGTSSLNGKVLSNSPEKGGSEGIPGYIVNPAFLANADDVQVELSGDTVTVSIPHDTIVDEHGIASSSMVAIYEIPRPIADRLSDKQGQEFPVSDELRFYNYSHNDGSFSTGFPTSNRDAILVALQQDPSSGKVKLVGTYDAPRPTFALFVYSIRYGKYMRLKDLITAAFLREENRRNELSRPRLRR